MAKILELSDPEVAALMRQHKRLVPWCSTNYNDEVTLTKLRDTHPQAGWGTIREMFNEAVPCRRRRSLDSIKNKWRSLRKRSREVSKLEFIPTLEKDTAAPEQAPLSQMLPEAYTQPIAPQAEFANDTGPDSCMNGQYNPTQEQKQSLVDLYAPIQTSAEYYEMLTTHWEGMANFEGHLASIVDELERLEAAKLMAIEAAAGSAGGA